MNNKQLKFYFDELEDRKNLLTSRLNEIMSNGNGVSSKAKNYGQGLLNSNHICSRMMTEDNLNRYESLLTEIENWLWKVL